MYYAVQNPFTGELHYPTGTKHWANGKPTVRSMLEEWGSEYAEVDIGDNCAPALLLKGAKNPLIFDAARDPVVKKAQRAALLVRKRGQWPMLVFTREGNGKPRRKTYLNKLKKGVVPSTYWADHDFLEPLDIGCTSWDSSESGTSEAGSRELRAILGNDHEFETVKPVKLFQKIVQLWCPTDGLVMDPFAGSGTTGHAVLAQNLSSGCTRRFILMEQGRPERGDSYARSLLAQRLRKVITGDWHSGRGTPLGGGFRFSQLQKKVDAECVLRMEREEMLDTVIASHFDASRRRGPGLTSLSEKGYRYLIASNADQEGFFLVWDGPGCNTNLTEEVYEAIANEASAAQLKAVYHVYGRLYVFQTDTVSFYQIPDRILSDFGLNMSSEPFSEETLT